MGNISVTFAEYLPNYERGSVRSGARKSTTPETGNSICMLRKSGQDRELAAGSGSEQEAREARPVGFEPTTFGFEVASCTPGPSRLTPFSVRNYFDPPAP